MDFVTGFCLSLLIGLNLLKLWNLANLGSKYSLFWVLIGFAASSLALVGLFVELNVLIQNYALDSTLASYVNESQLALWFGQAMLGFNVALSFSEVLFNLNIIAFNTIRGRGDSRKMEGDARA